MTGQPMPAIDPSNPFLDARAVDQEPDVAIIRHRELRREQAGSLYTKADAPRRMMLDQEYDLMRQAAGVTTLAEQQMAAQQQMEQQAEAEQAKGDAKSKDTQQKLDAQAQESDAQRQFDAQMADADDQMALTTEAMRSQGAPVPA